MSDLVHNRSYLCCRQAVTFFDYSAVALLNCSIFCPVVGKKSGRLDSNQRPLRPERSTLANLSYAPLKGHPSRISRTKQAFSLNP